MALQYPRPGRSARLRQPDAPAPWTLPRLLLLPSFGLIVALTSARWGLLPGWWIGYLVMSLLTFGAYTGDKWAAESGRWRTPETTLLGLGLMGGWPGGLLAQQLYRHKTSKDAFITSFWFSVVANIVIFVAFHAKLWPLMQRMGA